MIKSSRHKSAEVRLTLTLLTQFFIAEEKLIEVGFVPERIQATFCTALQKRINIFSDDSSVLY